MEAQDATGTLKTWLKEQVWDRYKLDQILQLAHATTMRGEPQACWSVLLVVMLHSSSISLLHLMVAGRAHAYAES